MAQSSSFGAAAAAPPVGAAGGCPGAAPSGMFPEGPPGTLDPVVFDAPFAEGGATAPTTNTGWAFTGPPAPTTLELGVGE
eukprot:3068456-Pyramimonas_sp.AAC.1